MHTKHLRKKRILQLDLGVVDEKTKRKIDCLLIFYLFLSNVVDMRISPSLCLSLKDQMRPLTLTLYYTSEGSHALAVFRHHLLRFPHKLIPVSSGDIGGFKGAQA